MLDLVVSGGTVVDGTGALGIRTDIGVTGDRITAIGDLAAAESHSTLDATGMVVAPGFIDIHSHSDFTLLVDPRAQSAIAQGVTTEVIGNCGHGCAPLTEPERYWGNIYGHVPGFPTEWRTTAEYLNRMDEGRPAVNIAALVPNGNLRLASVADPGKPATPREVATMVHHLEEGLDAGAFGYSTGLEYDAERASPEDETAALCRVVGQKNGLYATHTRNKEVRAVEAVEEGLRVAKASGVRIQVSHIIPRRGGTPNALDRVMDAVGSAHSMGIDAAFDAHTRLHGITNLSAALPANALLGGPDQVRARLTDPAFRDKMREYESLISSFALGGWDRVYLFKSKHLPEQVGKNFAALAPPNGDAFDAILDVLAAEADDPHAPMCICHSYEEEELRRTFRHPLCTVGSDATALAVDGPLAGKEFLGAFTWAAWFYRRMVRETGDLTIGEAIRKLAAAPADRLGLSDRGRIQKHAHADLAIFDPQRFGERGTLDHPNQLAEGMSHVVVNGVVALQNGVPTGDRGGRVLRRP